MELLEWMRINAFSGPIVIMFAAMVKSFFFLPIDSCELGTALALKIAFADGTMSTERAVLVSTLTVWTGFWIGSTLNMQLLRFLLGEESQKLFSRFKFARCINKVAEVHGLKMIACLRLSSLNPVNILVQFFALTSVSMQHVVLGGITSAVPIAVGSVQGTRIASLTDLEST